MLLDCYMKMRVSFAASVSESTQCRCAFGPLCRQTNCMSQPQQVCSLASSFVLTPNAACPVAEACVHAGQQSLKVLTLTSCLQLLAGRYVVLPERCSGGQAFVQFARAAGCAQHHFACKFFWHRRDYDVERQLYRNAALAAVLPRLVEAIGDDVGVDADDVHDYPASSSAGVCGDQSQNAKSDQSRDGPDCGCSARSGSAAMHSGALRLPPCLVRGCSRLPASQCDRAGTAQFVTPSCRSACRAVRYQSARAVVRCSLQAAGCVTPVRPAQTQHRMHTLQGCSRHETHMFSFLRCPAGAGEGADSRGVGGRRRALAARGARHAARRGQAAGDAARRGPRAPRPQASKQCAFGSMFVAVLWRRWMFMMWVLTLLASSCNMVCTHPIVLSLVPVAVPYGRTITCWLPAHSYIIYVMPRPLWLHSFTLATVMQSCSCRARPRGA